MAAQKDKLIIIRGRFRGSRAEFSAHDEGSTFRVCFNPTEYTVSKKTNFSEAAIPGLDSPVIQFNRGDAANLSVELMLDSYTYGEVGDVRHLYLDKLRTFLLVDGDLHAPPPCKVVWGSLEFVGLLESMSQRFVLFLDDGTPVRARVSLSFREYQPVEMQLAATPRASPDRRKIHTMKRDETLWQLAYEAYGDPENWRLIAEANGISNPRLCQPGRQLVIPALPRPGGIFAGGD
jgi:hypothetical protein